MRDALQISTRSTWWRRCRRLTNLMRFALIVRRINRHMLMSPSASSSAKIVPISSPRTSVRWTPTWNLCWTNLGIPISYPAWHSEETRSSMNICHFTRKKRKQSSRSISWAQQSGMPKGSVLWPEAWSSTRSCLQKTLRSNGNVPRSKEVCSRKRPKSSWPKPATISKLDGTSTSWKRKMTSRRLNSSDITYSHYIYPSLS